MLLSSVFPCCARSRHAPPRRMVGDDRENQIQVHGSPFNALAWNGLATVGKSVHELVISMLSMTRCRHDHGLPSGVGEAAATENPVASIPRLHRGAPQVANQTEVPAVSWAMPNTLFQHVELELYGDQRLCSRLTPADHFQSTTIGVLGRVRQAVAHRGDTTGELVCVHNRVATSTFAAPHTARKEAKRAPQAQAWGRTSSTGRVWGISHRCSDGRQLPRRPSSGREARAQGVARCGRWRVPPCRRGRRMRRAQRSDLLPGGSVEVRNVAGFQPFRQKALVAETKQLVAAAAH